MPKEEARSVAGSAGLIAMPRRQQRDIEDAVALWREYRRSKGREG